MWDLYTSLISHLKPKNGRLRAEYTDGAMQIVWMPQPYKRPDILIHYEVETRVVHQAISIDDLGRIIAGEMEQRYIQQVPALELEAMDHTIDAPYATAEELEEEFGEGIDDLPGKIEQIKKDNHQSKGMGEFLMDDLSPEELEAMQLSIEEAVNNPPPDQIFPIKDQAPMDHTLDAAAYSTKPPQDSQSCCCDCGSPIPGGPIQVDGKELVEAVIEGVKQWAPESRISYIMSTDPGYVFVFDEGMQWFTFHAPYFMQYVNRQSGKFELGDHGLDIVHSMVRQMQGIELEGSLAAEVSDGDQAAH